MYKLLAVILLLLTAAFAVTAQQNPPEIPNIPDRVIEVPMYEVSRFSNPGATTNGLVNGTCGSTYIYISDISDAFGGKANFWFGATSLLPTYGNIISATYSVNWVNNDSGQQGGQSGTNYPNSPNWSNNFNANTGYGLLEASMSGSAQVQKGASVVMCVFGNPTDTYEID